MSLELQRARPELETRTYVAPVVSMTPGERYKSARDPVSFLDFGAKTTLPKSLNPDRYQDIGERPHTPGPGVGAGSYDQNGITHMYR